MLLNRHLTRTLIAALILALLGTARVSQAASIPTITVSSGPANSCSVGSGVQLHFPIYITGATGAFTDNATLTVPGYGQTASGNLNSGPKADGNYLYNLWTTSTWTVPAHTILTMVHTTTGGATETFAFDCTTGGGGSSSAANPNCPGFGDSRINRCDAGQTVAIYCQSDGSIMVLNIDTGKGSLAFIATRAEIQAVSVKPATNTIIKAGNGATLYRLAGGELQVNRPELTGKMYAYRFVACP